MRRGWFLVARAAALLAALALATLVASPALAADPSVTLQAAQDQSGAWQLTAQVTAGGAPVGDKDVVFAVAVEFMGGQQWVSLGTVTTDSSGTASLAYEPTWNGGQQLRASVTGSGEIDSPPVAIDVTGAAPALPAEPESLPLMRGIAGPAVIVLALGVWALLAGTLLYGVLGVSRARGKRRREVAVPAGAQDSSVPS